MNVVVGQYLVLGVAFFLALPGVCQASEINGFKQLKELPVGTTSSHFCQNWDKPENGTLGIIGFDIQSNGEVKALMGIADIPESLLAGSQALLKMAYGSCEEALSGTRPPVKFETNHVIMCFVLFKDGKLKENGCMKQ